MSASSVVNPTFHAVCTKEVLGDMQHAGVVQRSVRPAWGYRKD
jgi:hypothetical protein